MQLPCGTCLVPGLGGGVRLDPNKLLLCGPASLGRGRPQALPCNIGGTDPDGSSLMGPTDKDTK